MKEELVKFNTAKLAKEKGFNLKTKYLYYENVYKDFKGEKITEPFIYYKHKSIYNINWNNYKPNIYISAPTQNSLKKWLKEKYNLTTNYELYDSKNNYKEILEKELKRLLKLIKN